jgi:hypothetical protein
VAQRGIDGGGGGRDPGGLAGEIEL